MVKFLGIEFCPLFIPLERRLQTLATLIGVIFAFAGPVLGFVFLLLMFLSPLWPIAVIYAAWIYFIDSDSSYKGRKLSKFVRGWSLWKYASSYFPIKLVASTTLEPNRNYIFGYHPHGVFAFGCFLSFCTEGTGFSKIFPGLQSRILTLPVLFKCPFYREIILWGGCCDVSKRTFIKQCSNSNGGNVVVTAVGGAEESLDAHPGATIVNLKNRKGFIRMALMTGASLVPVFAFGENGYYKQMRNEKGTWLRAIQTKLKSFLTFAPVLFHGRGIFQYSFGLLPYRHPVNIIVGAPIHVEKIAEPTMAEIDNLHQIYLEKVVQLFDTHKAEYATDPDPRLVII